MYFKEGRDRVVKLMGMYVEERRGRKLKKKRWRGGEIW